MKHVGDILSFVIGLLVPSRFIWLPLIRFIANVLGRRALEDYLDERFPKKPKVDYDRPYGK